ncbi:MAG: methyltransferase domain-containing protein [Candidatus Pacearchaeota archaeon]|nr:MAG: methyltransferase domain-containing protein [Candidatus Pacearchaeota archaeon]
MKPEILMRKALSIKYSPKERAEAFDKIYYDYVKEKGSDKNWDKFRIKLRQVCSNQLTDIQKNKFGLNKNNVKKAYIELKQNIPKKNKSFFPVEIFYENSFSLIKKITKGDEKILEIGFGDYPILINLLNKKGFSAFGIEPFPKAVDKVRTFKANMKNFPKKLDQKYDIILANMVYSINYMCHSPKKFQWELKNRKGLIKKISSLLDSEGCLILIDDIGTIFSKKYLEKYFKIILFEKDIPTINFKKDKVEGYERITLLKKRG